MCGYNWIIAKGSNFGCNLKFKTLVDGLDYILFTKSKVFVPFSPFRHFYNNHVPFRPGQFPFDGIVKEHRPFAYFEVNRINSSLHMHFRIPFPPQTCFPFPTLVGGAGRYK